MTHSCASQQDAEREAERLNAEAREGGWQETERFEARIHDIAAKKWGVVRLARYSDRPDLGWIFRSFIWNVHTYNSKGFPAG